MTIKQILLLFIFLTTFNFMYAMFNLDKNGKGFLKWFMLAYLMEILNCFYIFLEYKYSFFTKII